MSGDNAKSYSDDPRVRLERVHISGWELAAILEVRMCADTLPASVDHGTLDSFLNTAARQFGYSDWIEAYHTLVKK
jgi:hypothetical protein